MKKLKNPNETYAAEIMTKPIEAVRMSDPLTVVTLLFKEKNISAAAVLDQNKKPIGIITKTDLIRHEQEKGESSTMSKIKKGTSNSDEKNPAYGFHMVEEEDIVEHWMTPVILSVSANATLREIARQMVRYGIHHIFVQGKTDTMVGIISSFDVLRQVAAGR